MMARADDHPHLVGRLAVERVVGIESPRPHGRPEEIAFQSEDEFEHLLIETVVAEISAESILYPCGETRRLVVEEDATVAHPGLAIGIRAPGHIYFVMMFHGHIGPVVPRRHPYLPRQLVDAINGSTPVGPSDNQLVIDRSDDILLAFVFQCFFINVLCLHQPVDGSRMPNGARHDAGSRVVSHHRFLPTHPAEIGSQTACGDGHALAVIVIDINPQVVRVEQQVATIKAHEAWCC